MLSFQLLDVRTPQKLEREFPLPAGNAKIPQKQKDAKRMPTLIANVKSLVKDTEEVTQDIRRAQGRLSCASSCARKLFV